MTSNSYLDTRGNSRNISFTRAVIDGIAEGGGLYVPETLPSLDIDAICSLAKLPYWEQAATIYKRFDIDLPYQTIDECMKRAYASQFDNEAICPITTLDEKLHILELWHGPTSAFKDMALQALPEFFSASAEALRAKGELENDFLILVATSGDTGKAALEGFKGVKDVSIAVMYPHGGVSDIQFKQMATQTGNNVCVWSVKGNFDDCQTAAKNIFGDEAFGGILAKEHRTALSSANSINWGRLLPQIVYYISAYSQLVAKGSIQAGEYIDVCVPTGNFGNILACYYAREMGVPIERLVCASNDNKVLCDFINTGVYDISHRTFILTPSPSMDILVSSNLERQLFELTNRDPERITTWMKDLKEKKCFTVDEKTKERLSEVFASDFVSSAECLSTIKEVFESYNYLLDPHTAVAYRCAINKRSSNHMLVASTAHWAKFGNNVYRALHDLSPDQKLPDQVDALTGCQLNELIAQETGDHNIPTPLACLDSTPIRFTEVLDNNITDIENSIEAFLRSLPNQSE